MQHDISAHLIGAEAQKRRRKNFEAASQKKQAKRSPKRKIIEFVPLTLCKPQYVTYKNSLFARPKLCKKSSGTKINFCRVPFLHWQKQPFSLDTINILNECLTSQSRLVALDYLMNDEHLNISHCIGKSEFHAFRFGRRFAASQEQQGIEKSARKNKKSTRPKEKEKEKIK